MMKTKILISMLLLVGYCADTFAQNFGIGTAAPSEKITTYIRNSPVAAKIYNDSGAARIGVATAAGNFGATKGGDVVIQNQSNKGIGFGTNGDNIRMYISNTGRVGIGTSSPATLLHVSGTGGTVSSTLTSAVATDRAILGINNSAGSGASFDVRAYGNSYTETLFGNNMAGGSSVTSFNFGTAPMIIGTYATGSNMIFGTNNTERMRFLSNGNLGIGTAAPTTMLHINAASSPAFRLVDGTQAANTVLTSDANGNASWLVPAASITTGTLPASGVTISSNNATTYTGAAITLAPGNWLVNLGSTAVMSANNVADGEYWLGLFLSDNNSSFASSPDINTALTGTGIRGGVGRGMDHCFINGVLAISNTSGANKTYYVWAVKAIVGTGTPTTSNWVGVLDNTNLERYFYAIQIN